MKDTIYLTKVGLAMIRSELDYLVKVRRQEIAQAFREAEISELSVRCEEYGYLMDERALVESKIEELELMLKKVKVIEGVDTDRVSVGTRVKLRFLDDGRVETYAVVGTHEANPMEKKISDESPMARAIMGKRVGDEVKVNLKLGESRMRVLGIDAL